LWRNW